jgi:glyoxylate reductase
LSLFAIPHPIPEEVVERLRQAGEVRLGGRKGPISPAELHQLVDGADAVLTFLYDRVDAEMVAAAGPNLRCVANVAVGYDNVDVAALNAAGVVVTNTPGVLTDATADLAIALLLAVTRRVGEGERLIRAGKQWRWDFDFLLGAGLRGKRLGVIGMGDIGQATARRARAFGLEIAYHNRNRLPEVIEAELEAELLGLEELLATSDFVSLHCPLTAETRHLIGADELAQMKKSSYLVNTARGPIVDENALVEALRRGEIAGAGLDVFEHEPAVEAGLLELENVVLLPHLGSATVETRTAMADLAASNAIAVCAGAEALTPIGDLKRR